MQSLMVRENDWPQIKACVISAAKLIGQLAHPTSSTTLTEQTTLLQSGLKRLLTAEQFSAVTVQARDNMAILEYQPSDLIGLVCQVACGEMRPTTTPRQDVAIKLMTVLLSSPAYVEQGPDQASTRGPRSVSPTRHDTQLYETLAVLDLEAFQLPSGLLPVLIARIRGTQDAYIDQLLLAAPLDDAAYVKAMQLIAPFFERYPADVPAAQHWHRLACAALAPTLASYDSQQPSPVVARVLIKILDSQLDLDHAYTLQRAYG
ncbi:hypothetical protein ACFOPQ_05215 [Deinococcus antarcticus]|uniref:Uncharacterized protein n=1 Tax=Deinococcus antarcticus TaxID=1298767 RepID=A0ABV8A3B1_9DEIO